MALSSAASSSLRRGPYHRQRGVALIASLTALAIVVTAASALAYQLHVNTRRSQNVVAAEHAWQLALSVESDARALLAADRESSDIDYRGQGADEEPWFRQEPIRRDRRGSSRVVFALTDLQGRLNLNTLAGDLSAEQDGASQGRREPNKEGGEAARAHFDRLLRRGTGVASRDSLSNALADWIDPDQQRRFPGGAEDGFYTRREVPYRAANHPLAAISELRLIKGIRGERMARLWNAVCPFVSALPPDASGINVNTAPQGVLATIADDVPTRAAEQAVSGRSGQPYESVEGFRKRNRGMVVPGLDASRLQVASHYFLLRIRVERSRADLDVYSILHRPAEGAIEVIHRSRAVPVRLTGNAGDASSGDGNEPRPCVGTRLDF